MRRLLRRARRQSGALDLERKGLRAGFSCSRSPRPLKIEGVRLPVPKHAEGVSGGVRRKGR